MLVLIIEEADLFSFIKHHRTERIAYILLIYQLAKPKIVRKTEYWYLNKIYLFMILKLIFLSLLLLLCEDAWDCLRPEPEPVLEIVLHHSQLGVDLHDRGGGGGERGPGGGDVLCQPGGRHTRLGEVGQQRRENVTGELGVRRRHLELLAPDPVEDVLEVVAVGHAHVDLLPLEVDDAVLAPVLEAVLVGRHRVVAQQLGEPVSAPGVHQVSQELDISGPELLLALHVDISEVSLADLKGMHDLRLIH